ncbi:hypothetical protein GGI07_005648 [Coemansia sp. Benny D115]|nr:hypothetical protein GGI07_005648 [Coemansia sp. Benny D115]
MDAAVAECTKAIRSRISAHSRGSNASGDWSYGGSCFVLVSQSYPAADIELLPRKIRQQMQCDAASTPSIAGTVVETVFSTTNGASCSGLAMLYHAPNKSTPHQTGESNIEGRLFHVGDMHGRQRLREIAVGRWHNEMTDRFSKHSSATQWIPGQSSVTRAASQLQLPPELASAAQDASRVKLLVFATDKESRQVLDALDKSFPHAAKLGIVGSQTPFLNGREFTIFNQDKISDSGVVGFAFIDMGKTSADDDCEQHRPPKIVYRHLEPISDVLEIKRCKGNVLLDVENGEAARALISIVRKHRTDTHKAGVDNRLFARISKTKEGVAHECSTTDSAIFQVTGGDPAKGGLAIDTLRDLSPGHYVQFMMTTRNQPEHASVLQAIHQRGARPSANQIALAFGASDSAGPGVDGGADDLPANLANIASIFGGASEGGFVYGGSSRTETTLSATQSSDNSVFSGSSECAVPESVALLLLDQRIK